MTDLTPNRRAVLASAAGLIVAAAIPLPGRAKQEAWPFAPNAFIRITPDNIVKVLVKHSELGQGTWTGLTTMVAEELDADWAQMWAENAPANVQLYASSIFGVQGTGGSTATPASWLPMRQAGAAARAVLVEAAARAWGVPGAEITVSRGVVAHQGRSSDLRASFGELVPLTENVVPPADPILKTPDQFTLIGRDVPRIDAPEKSNGTAIYSIDVVRDGMLTVAVARPPKFGARLVEFDSATALATPGVRRVEQIPTGVAVYADDTWSAFRGRDALDIVWDETGAETRSSDEMMTVWAEAARTAPAVAEDRGDVDAAMASADEVIEAEFRFPFLSHAAMEPLDGVVELSLDRAEFWMGSQWQTSDQNEAAARFGVPPENIAINTMLTGGSFGRRTTADNHFTAELSEIAKAAGPGAYKLIWSREDDMRGGYYRPLTVHYMQGGLDAKGNIVAWRNNVATQSLLADSPFEQFIADGIDGSSVEGSRGLPYRLPNARVALATMESSVPVLWWRAVGHTHTAYATEVFLDELLERGGKDRVQGRLDLLDAEDADRHRGVLERVAEIADWQGPDAGNGIARGVALHKSFGSFVAMIADVSIERDEPRIHKVWAAVDCGIAINPSIIEAQVAGGLGFGLSAAMFEEIRLLEGGDVDRWNYDAYRIMRNAEMPEVEVAIIESRLSPTGIGEPGTPPIAPAVGNALRALTGQTPRRLPFVAS
ncbi:xanthine dehydrogenase family protein molybdopterin-binding subunit [Roseobacter sinensis]|uniref:Xanthine dehydrogenase family protein molybdopterin-binding subunit n=1 Tax=Roseobacter sinensis TaxID=2931391 RepID=A0ABT3BIZ1_9RHOB|nr:xanthine dehydrogenase family protein molybdopterin-binding subunit [Roseobacter sp. WL0113]MCV3273324.1 xanthine dehydrogenase family protein molybdopterin-binding subunit [Roseobacter sp. WL0113]